MDRHEIERKWLVERGDDAGRIEALPSVVVEQFYTRITDDVETRYSIFGDLMHITKKIGKGIERKSTSGPVTAGEYEAAKACRVGSVVLKTRRFYTIDVAGQESTGQLLVTIDDYTIPPIGNGRAIAKVEFGTVEEAEAFEFPPEIVPGIFKHPVDVTCDERWKDKWIAVNGVPSKNEGFTEVPSAMVAKAFDYLSNHLDANDVDGETIVTRAMDILVPGWREECGEYDAGNRSCCLGYKVRYCGQYEDCEAPVPYTPRAGQKCEIHALKATIRGIIAKTFYIENGQDIYWNRLDAHRALRYIENALDGKYDEKRHEFECLICGDCSFGSKDELEEHEPVHFRDDVG